MRGDGRGLSQDDGFPQFRYANFRSLGMTLSTVSAALDDAADLRYARTDPGGFVDSEEPLLIDEVQRGGDPLVMAIKSRVDRSDRPGQMILAGSTWFLTEPRLSESLAGRARFVDLWPLAQGEIDRIAGGDSFVDRAFLGAEALMRVDGGPAPRREVFARACRGGYPESVRATSERVRRAFFVDYVRTLSHELNLSDLANGARTRRAGRSVGRRSISSTAVSPLISSGCPTPASNGEAVPSEVSCWRRWW